MAIQWNILSNALATNPGDAFNASLQTSMARATMSALGQNPADPRAMNALMAFNPQAGMAMQDRQQTQRRGAAQAEEQELENRRNDIVMGASFLEGVTDEAGYQAARQRAQSAGVNIAGAPETFDPNWAGQVRQTAQALITAQQRRSPQTGATNIQREVEYYRSIGRNDLAESRLRNHAEGGPVLFDVTGDGVPDAVPRSYFHQPQGQPTASPPPSTSVPPPPPGFILDEEGGAESAATPANFRPNEFIDPNAAGGWRR
jgi:hypothetical protein